MKFLYLNSNNSKQKQLSVPTNFLKKREINRVGRVSG